MSKPTVKQLTGWMTEEVRKDDHAVVIVFEIKALVRARVEELVEHGLTADDIEELLEKGAGKLVEWFQRYFELAKGADIYMHHDPNHVLCSYFNKSLPGELIVSAAATLDAMQIDAMSKARAADPKATGGYFAWCARDNKEGDVA